MAQGVEDSVYHRNAHLWYVPSEEYVVLPANTNIIDYSFKLIQSPLSYLSYAQKNSLPRLTYKSSDPVGLLEKLQ